jgi:outer membrane protein insertion porin family
MNNKKYYLIFFLISSLFWAGCSNTKHLPPNEKLYTGAIVKVSGASTVREKKVLDEDMEGLTRPKPNSKILGMRIKLSIYNLFRNKKPKSFWGKLRDKYGEPPVLLSQVDLEHNVKVLQSHIENNGYFRAKITGDTIVRKKMAKAEYKAVAGPQYTINTIHFPTDSSLLSLNIAASANNSLLNVGDPFNLQVIKGERDRIDAYLKERGFYFFSPDYLLIKTDTTIGNHKADMYITVKPETPLEAMKIFRINNVYIYSGYSLNTAQQDTSMANAQFSNGYYLIDRKNRFKPSLFQRAMQFNPGDVYSRTDHNQTLNRLINMDLFKFVKNRFEVAKVDSPMLDAYYYLTPQPTKSLRFEATAISRSNNLNGSEFRLSWLSRNLFKGGEHVNVSAYVGSDVQFSGAYSGYNTFRTGAALSFVIPRFVTPFGDIPSDGGFMPRTSITLGYDILQRQKLYTLNSYRFEYAYNWKPNIQIQHKLSPFVINYVQPLNVTEDFKKLEDQYPGLSKTIEPQFILGSSYEYIFNQMANGSHPINAFFFDGNVDVSGNIAGLITGANVKKGDTALIYNTPFSQYVKFETDGRYYRRIGLHSTWANRIDIGIGYPYGNSVQIPYIKQFFVGGNNSLRGFRSRGVGPGTYYPVNDTINVLPDETGDIKFEVNTEYRPRISGPLYGALFIDAGNIWLVNDTTYTHKPGSQFTSKFLSQLAIDAGVGIRLDITIFVIRLDVAFPLRKPWLDNPWVINHINFGNQSWRQNNIIYNLAIGYPF